MNEVAVRPTFMERVGKMLGLNTKALNNIDSNRGWFPLIRESFPGAWQQNVEVNMESVLSNPADFACRTLIASDISKLAVRLVELDANGIWKETKNPAYSPVLRKPNHFQNRMQFFENWVLSKLQTGNTVILKQRDNRNVVTKLYILDFTRVTPMVSTSGDIFYELWTDQLSGLEQRVVVPASEIIHDRFNCMFHPLVGVSPIFASGLASVQGLAIQSNSTHFFRNGSNPGGVLTAPGAIEDATAARLKAYWDEQYTGKNRGKVAVLGDGLKYETMTTKAVDAQLIEQLKWTAETVCSTYHVPPYKIGVGSLPSYNNVQALNTEYYSQCLQVLIEAIELCLDEGLATGEMLGTEFDIDNLLRMDSVTQMDVIDKAKNTLTPNEARKRLNYGPIEGGNAVFRQQQDFSLAALAKRDAKDDPFAKDTGATAAPAAATGTPDDEAANDNLESEAKSALIAIMKGLQYEAV